MPPTALPAQVYRFSAVVFDAGAFQLCVDGHLRPCPARVLRLLHVLCAAPGRLFTRDELIAALWTEPHRVSDESLGQIVFKLRQVLGDDSARLVTVRGAGLRLDAEVSATPSTATSVLPDVADVPDGEATQEPPVSSARHDGTDSDPAPRASLSRSRRMTFIACVVAALIVAVVITLTPWRRTTDPADDVLGAWGFDARQLHVARSDTGERLQAALKVDASGDRAAAQAMLAAIHVSDTSTPVPALLLSVMRAGAGDRSAAEHWLAQARPRVEASADAAATAWLDLAQGFAQGQNTPMAASLTALLEREPDAWILRHIRAQLRLQRGQREAALDDLKRIPIPSLADRRLEDVLATRAALGDRTGAQALYERLDPNAHPVSHAAVGALLAWSADDRPKARRDFDTTAALALRENRDDWAIRGNLLAAVLAFDADDPSDARRRVSNALAIARDAHETLSVIDAELMLAQIASAQGDADACRLALTRAADAATRSGDTAWMDIVNVVALRLGSETVARVSTPDTDLTAQGLSVLLAARVAWHAGDIDKASNLLQHAATAPAMVAEEYALLARDLHVPWTPPPRADPPSPPYFRLLGAIRVAKTTATTTPENAAPSPR